MKKAIPPPPPAPPISCNNPYATAPFSGPPVVNPYNYGGYPGGGMGFPYMAPPPPVAAYAMQAAMYSGYMNNANPYAQHPPYNNYQGYTPGPYNQNQYPSYPPPPPPTGSSTAPKSTHSTASSTANTTTAATTAAATNGTASKTTTAPGESTSEENVESPSGDGNILPPGTELDDDMKSPGSTTPTTTTPTTNALLDEKNISSKLQEHKKTITSTGAPIDETSQKNAEEQQKEVIADSNDASKLTNGAVTSMTKDTTATTTAEGKVSEPTSDKQQ